MNRKDYDLVWDREKGSMVNGANINAAERASRDMRVNHLVILECSLDEIDILARGLVVLRAQEEIRAARAGIDAHTKGFEDLRTELTTPKVVEEGLPHLPQ